MLVLMRDVTIELKSCAGGAMFMSDVKSNCWALVFEVPFCATQHPSGTICNICATAGSDLFDAEIHNLWCVLPFTKYLASNIHCGCAQPFEAFLYCRVYFKPIMLNSHVFPTGEICKWLVNLFYRYTSVFECYEDIAVVFFMGIIRVSIKISRNN